MNGRTAKRLRHKVYGDGSKRNEFRYFVDERGTRVCMRKRHLYLELKKGGGR